MLTATQIRQFRAAEADLDVTTVSALLEFLRRLGPVDRTDLLEAAMDVVPELVAQMGASSGALAAAAYDLSRDQSDARGRFEAAIARGALRSQVQGMVGWAANPAATAVRDLDTGEITDRLSAGTQRLVRQSYRDTTTEAADLDPDRRTRWARVPRSGACGFCVLLASRHAVYLSEDTALRSSGAGKQPAGHKFHDNCRCQIVALPGGGAKPLELTVLVQRFGTVTADYRNPKDAMRAWNRFVDAENRVVA